MSRVTAAYRRRGARELLACVPAGVLLALAVSALGSCRGGDDPARETSSYQESPMLRERVEAGELPPVDERLPDEPLVVDVPQVGEYGGSIGGGRVIQSDDWRPVR